MEFKKIEIKDYVMLPRLQHPGLKPKHVERDAFKAELKQEPSFIKGRVLALYDAVYWCMSIM